MQRRMVRVVLAVVGMSLIPYTALGADDMEAQLQDMQKRLGQLEERLESTTDQLEVANDRLAEQQAGCRSDGVIVATPTGSTALSFEETAIFVRSPGSRTMPLISTIFSVTSGTSNWKSLATNWG